jgi:uncharacterized protein YsxB (DUF464 family)
MIKVFVGHGTKSILKITVTGHGPSSCGYDLICAGVSSCVTGALNNLKDIDNFNIILDSGNFLCEAKKEPSYHDQVVLETLVTQLMTISKEYPHDVSVVSKKEG